jgi:hypothetical protein
MCRSRARLDSVEILRTVDSRTVARCSAVGPFPLGTVVTRYTDSVRQYVWDPGSAHQFNLETTPLRGASPPPDAKDTGYHKDDVRLWVADSDSMTAVYLQHPDGTFDRWPRAMRPILCS